MAGIYFRDGVERGKGVKYRVKGRGRSLLTLF